jgi:phage terminase small subunit
VTEKTPARKTRTRKPPETIDGGPKLEPVLEKEKTDAMTLYAPMPAPSLSGDGPDAEQRRMLFLGHYFADPERDRLKAALAAGYSAQAAEGVAATLLAEFSIHLGDPGAAELSDAEEAKRREEQPNEEKIVMRAKVRNELARLAFFDPRKLYNSDGTPKDLDQLDADTAAAVVGVDVVESGSEKAGTRATTRKYRLANKLTALELLGKHLRMFADKSDLAAKGGKSLDMKVLIEHIGGFTGQNTAATKAK